MENGHSCSAIGWTFILPLKNPAVTLHSARVSHTFSIKEPCPSSLFKQVVNIWLTVPGLHLQSRHPLSAPWRKFSRPAVWQLEPMNYCEVEWSDADKDLNMDELILSTTQCDFNTCFRELIREKGNEKQWVCSASWFTVKQSRRKWGVYLVNHPFFLWGSFLCNMPFSPCLSIPTIELSQCSHCLMVYHCV